MSKKTISRTTHYDGLYKEESSHLYDYIFCEEIQTRSKDFQWEIASHFHSQLYQFFIAEKGNAEFLTNELKYELKAPFLCFIPPNCSHGFRFSEDVQGNIFTFSNFYVDTLRSIPAYKEILDIKEIQINSNIDKQNFQSLLEIFTKIHTEIFNQKRHITEALQFEIALLFIKISRIQVYDQLRQENNDQNLDLFKKFTDRIKHYQSPFIPIQQYADDINISAGHLNRICRKAKDKSALQVIHDYIIQQAKIYLHHTTYSINEVAYQLGINDPSYFIRLFKKQTGLTPGQFREESFLKKK